MYQLQVTAPYICTVFNAQQHGLCPLTATGNLIKFIVHHEQLDD